MIQLPEYLTDVTFVAFDTETTGLFAPTQRIVEIGAVKFRLGEAKADTFQELVNPERRIPADAIRVHHITDDMVVSADTAPAVLKRFCAFAGDDTVLISHNAPFDISFVGWELDRAGMSFGNNLILDTVDIFHRLFPGLISYSLESLVKQFKIAHSQDHRALADALFVREMFTKAAPLFPSAPTLQSGLGNFSVHTMAEWSGQEPELPDKYSDLRLAVDRNLSTEIIYESPTRGPETRVVRPKRIFARGGRFYLVAHCEQAAEERTFRLDRIPQYRLLTLTAPD